MAETPAEIKQAEHARALIRSEKWVQEYREKIKERISQTKSMQSSVLINCPPPQVLHPGDTEFPDFYYVMDRVVRLLRDVDKFDVTWVSQHPSLVHCSWALSRPIQGEFGTIEDPASFKPEPIVALKSTRRDEIYSPSALDTPAPPLILQTKKSTPDITTTSSTDFMARARKYLN